MVGKPFWFFQQINRKTHRMAHRKGSGEADVLPRFLTFPQRVQLLELCSKVGDFQTSVHFKCKCLVFAEEERIGLFLLAIQEQTNEEKKTSCSLCLSKLSIDLTLNIQKCQHRYVVRSLKLLSLRSLAFKNAQKNSS